MTCDWKETGRSRLEVEVRPRGRGEVVRYDYVRCARCRRVGFKRSGRRVVYTWEQTR